MEELKMSPREDNLQAAAHFGGWWRLKCQNLWRKGQGFCSAMAPSGHTSDIPGSQRSAEYALCLCCVWKWQVQNMCRNRQLSDTITHTTSLKAVSHLPQQGVPHWYWWKAWFCRILSNKTSSGSLLRLAQWEPRSRPSGQKPAASRDVNH